MYTSSRKNAFAYRAHRLMRVLVSTIHSCFRITATTFSTSGKESSSPTLSSRTRFRQSISHVGGPGGSEQVRLIEVHRSNPDSHFRRDPISPSNIGFAAGTNSNATTIPSSRTTILYRSLYPVKAASPPIRRGGTPHACGIDTSWSPTENRGRDTKKRVKLGRISSMD